MNIIETDGLGKCYRRTWALRDCTLSIPAGSVVALVGHNGAGKTTLLNLLVGLIKPTEGSASLLGPAIKLLGTSNDAVRYAWPDALEAALELGRVGAARELLALLAGQPPGRVPPYLRAQLTRGRGLVNAVDAHHEAVETNLETAIDAFEKLGYPYWHAVTQTDLAAWHIDQHQPDAAVPLLEQAVATLTPLRAAPALTRAYGLTQAPTSVAP